MLTSYLTTYNPAQCYGCRACEQVCPKNAISMTLNSEGFLYPVVSAMKCIDCSLCYKTCPYDNNAQKLMPLQAFALQYNDEERLISSSSGAAFPAKPCGRAPLRRARKIPLPSLARYDERARRAFCADGRRRQDDGAHDKILEVCGNFCLIFTENYLHFKRK